MNMRVLVPARLDRIRFEPKDFGFTVGSPHARETAHSKGMHRTYRFLP